MYYPFVHQNRFIVCRLVAAFVFILFVLVSFHSPAFSESDETVAEQFRSQGIECQQKGQYEQALFLYTRAALLNPESPAILNDMGLMQEYLGMKDKAEESYLKSLELDSGYLPVYYNLGGLYANQKNYVLAVQYLKKRIEMGSSEDPWTLKAQEQLQKVYDAVPALSDKRLRLEAEDFAQKIAENKKNLQRAAQKNKAVGFEIAYQKGLTFLEARRYDEAIETLQTAVALNPRSGNARYALKRAKYDRDKLLLEAQARMTQSEAKSRTVVRYLDHASGQMSSMK